MTYSQRHTLQITTLNINGLHDDRKRHKTYDFLNNRKNDITLTQETHSTPEWSRKWKNEWTGKSIWHTGPIPKSSGIAILFKEKSEIEIIHTNKDKEGRIIQCNIKYEQEILQIINIYSPTNPTDRKDFYINLQKFIDYDQKTIIAGDFNMIENLFLDRIGGNPNKTYNWLWNL